MMVEDERKKKNEKERPLKNEQWEEEGEDVDEDEDDEREEDTMMPLDIHRNSLMHRTEIRMGYCRTMNWIR